MKQIILFIKYSGLLELALCAVLLFFALFARAGTGWCTADNGTKKYMFDYTKNITNPDENKAGEVKERIHEWNKGGKYNVTCDCSNMSLKPPNAPVWYKAVVPGLLPGYSDGHLQFYILNDYLEVASEVWIEGGVTDYFAIPFDNKSNEDTTAKCIGLKSFNNFLAGSRGYISLYIKRPFVGEINIPETTIMELYGSRVSGSYGSTPMSLVSMSGKITVPQSCTINAGQVINVEFNNIESKDISTKGQMGAAEKQVDATLTCSNIAQGVKVSLSFNGANDRNDHSALATSSPDIGIRVKDVNHQTVTPNESQLPVMFDYAAQKGIGTLFLAPFNTSGKAPEIGNFNAIATLDAEIQ